MWDKPGQVFRIVKSCDKAFLDFAQIGKRIIILFGHHSPPEPLCDSYIRFFVVERQTTIPPERAVPPPV